MLMMPPEINIYPIVSFYRGESHFYLFSYYDSHRLTDHTFPIFSRFRFLSSSPAHLLQDLTRCTLCDAFLLTMDVKSDDLSHRSVPVCLHQQMTDTECIGICTFFCKIISYIVVKVNNITLTTFIHIHDLRYT